MDKNNRCYKLLALDKAIIICLIILSACLTACAGDNYVEFHHQSSIDDGQDSTTYVTYDINRFSKSSDFLALLYNNDIYYYADVIYDINELSYYVSLAELVGIVESTIADENSPKMHLESNFLEVGTKLYLQDEYIIAAYEEPQEWQNKVIYGQILIIKNK